MVPKTRNAPSFTNLRMQLNIHNPPGYPGTTLAFRITPLGGI